MQCPLRLDIVNFTFPSTSFFRSITDVLAQIEVVILVVVSHLGC